MRVLFWGTPAFALPTLRALQGEGHMVVGVVTRPDRPAGRGRPVRPSPVKELAQDEGLPVLQPERPRGDEVLRALADLAPEVSVVAAYGRFLPRAVLDLPEHGTVNVHPSLLPELRGAAPIPWAIIRGLERTGVTVIRLVEEMDAGPILYQVAEPIHPEESGTELAARLSEVGAEALIEALALMEAGALTPMEQDHERATLAPSLEREECQLDWALPAVEVANWIRGLADAPGAWTLHHGDVLKPFRPRPVPEHEHDAAPGTVLALDAGDPGGVLVGCGRGAVWVREVKPSGRRRISAGDWIRGRGVAQGERLGA